jgi:DNA-binding MarR family transcriptional regulator
VTVSHERVASEDHVVLRGRPSHIDLPEMLTLLARVKASLCADVDASLRDEHGLSLEAFDAVTVISQRSEDCDEPKLAAALALPREDVGALVDSLVSSGHASRTPRPDEAGPPVVRLTLRGTLLLERAQRTLDRELNRRIGSWLSPRDIAGLEDALATLRRHSIPSVRTVWGNTGRRRRWVENGCRGVNDAVWI